MFHRGTATDFSQWRSLVSNSFVPLQTEQAGRSAFRGAIDVQDCGSAVMTQVSAHPHAVVRTDALIAADAEHFYKVSYQLQGHGLLIQDGREVVLEPGTLAIYDTSRPYTLSFDREFSTYVMMFPHHRVNLARGMVNQLTATRLGEDHALGAVAGQVMGRAGAILPQLDEAIGVRLAGNVVDLLTTVMADELASGHDASATTAQRLLDDVLVHIEANLDDVGLTPSSIAAAHFISVRTLHGLFEGTGETVSAVIRRRRVQRSREALADPLLKDVPVAQIGARWGLPDPAHFSRVFRSLVGRSPAAYRRESLDASTPAEPREPRSGACD